MRILFVTTDKYPDFGTTVNIFKKLFFAGNLVSLADEIGVLTVKNRICDSDYINIDGINVHRIEICRYFKKDDLYSLFQRHEWQHFINVLLSKIKYKIDSAFYGDSFLRKDDIKLLSDNIEALGQKYDVIMPIFGNYDTAIASANAVKKLNKKLALYQVDPCSTNWVRKKSEIANIRKIEIELYKTADLIFTMPVIYNDVIKICNKKDINKFKIIELPLIVDKCCPKRIQSNKKIKCVFSGLIYLGIRNPKYTLQLFKGLIESDKVELHMVGVTKNQLPQEFQGLDIICHGIVNMEKADSVMEEADVLVNIGNLMNNQIPSKIFDYISYGKPIVNVCKNRDCPTLKYMNKYPLVLNLFEENDILESQIKTLEEFICSSKDARLSFEEINSLYEECTPKYCGAQIRDELKRLLSI